MMKEISPDNEKGNSPDTVLVDSSRESTPLRRQAEAKLAVREALQPETFDAEKSRRLLHELRVHQIELEIQNEELRQSQQQLQASQVRFKDLYDFAPVGYVTVSEAGLILEANRTTATLLNVAADALVGQPISHFILPEDQDIYYHSRMAFSKTLEPQNCKLRLLRADHPPFWSRFEAAAGKDWCQGLPVCRIMLSDIHAGVLLAEERNQLEVKYRQLEKADSLGLMAGSIAHHFNNLLAVVMGNLELARDELPKDSVIGVNVDSAMSAAKRAAEVSGSMLTYLGQALGKYEPLDLAETCRAGLCKIRMSIPENVELLVDFPGEGPMVNANAHQLQQVLKHLVTNGWEARSEGRNSLCLSVKTLAPADLPEKNYFPLDWQLQDVFYACLEVSDSGCGIAASDIGKIFDPFFSSKFFGRGLGLPIVLGIVKALGGVVAVASEVGQGSAFSIFLPIVSGAIVRPKEPSMTAQVSLEAGTILVVDDEPMLCTIAEAMLLRLGFSVLIAGNGVEAVAMYRQNREAVCCVLSDLSMPHMDGWQMLTALRRLNPDLPIILTSGYDQTQVMAGDHPDLPQFFLGKPYSFPELREAIRDALAGSKVERFPPQSEMLLQ